LAALSTAVSPVVAVAQSSSDEGPAFLLVPVGADAVALGRAVTAMTGHESALWNPAGLASLDGSRVVVVRGDQGLGPATVASVLFARPGVGTLGISYLLMDVGGQDQKDDDGNLIGALTYRDHLAVVSAAARLLPGVDVGVNAKLIQSRLSCRGDCRGLAAASTGYALDAGVQVTPLAGVPLRVGAMVAHLGPRFQHENASQADPLPTRVRLGAAYDVLARLARPDLQGWISAEVQNRLRPGGGPSFYIGSKVVAGASDALVLRAGYARDAEQVGGASVGIGFRYDRFEIAVAKSPAGSLVPTGTEPFNVSLAIAF
jgi:hypothetical protein